MYLQSADESLQLRCVVETGWYHYTVYVQYIIQHEIHERQLQYHEYNKLNNTFILPSIQQGT